MKNCAKGRLILQYNKPSPATQSYGNANERQGVLDWQQWTLPIGNGYSGANIYGTVLREQLQISEESLWTGGPRAAGATAGGEYDLNTAIGLVDNNGELIKPELYFAARDLALSAKDEINPPNATDIVNATKKILPSAGNLGRQPLGLYQNFAEVYCHFKHDGKAVDFGQVNGYTRWLNIENATSGVKYEYNGVNYTREYFASYPDRVIVTKFAADKSGKLAFMLNPVVPHLTSYGKPGDESWGKTACITVNTQQRTIEINGALNQNGMRFAAKFQIVTDGNVTEGEIDGNGTLTVTDAESAVIIMSHGTDYVNDFAMLYRSSTDPMVAVHNRLEAAVNKGYADLRARHVNDYKNIFDRVKLDLGGVLADSDPPTDELLHAYQADNTPPTQRKPDDKLYFLEELYFQYGRYLLIASSREGTLPANLQGVWNCEPCPPWQSDYHLNINLQMNYWPAANTNMQETLYALVDYMDSLRRPGREAAYRIFGVGEGMDGPPLGWVAFVSSNPMGFAGVHDTRRGAKSVGLPQWSPESAMWMMQNVYDMYQFYPDEAYLRDKIYPIIKESALFYSHPNVLVKDPVSGRMVMAPTFSSEHGPMWCGTTFQQQLLWQLFSMVIESSEILCVDEDLREKLKDLRNKLSNDGENGVVPIGPISGINNTPGVKEWWWETGYLVTAEGDVPDTQPTHRHLSHLVGLYPGSLITADTPEWMNAAVGSLNIRQDFATGWSRGHKTNLWARTGDGDRAYKIFDGLIKEATFENLWDFHEMGNYKGCYQIDGNFGGTAGMIEMILHSHAGYIQPLPSLPNAWCSGSVAGITARGGFVVDMAWQNKQLTALEITSNAGKPCVIKYGDASRITVNGGAVPVTVDEASNTAAFPTVKGEKYVVAVNHS